MKDWIRAEDLFCGEYRALMLLEHSREINQLKKLIEITEQSIERKKRSDTFSFDGICYLFAKSIVGYAKSAFDNMLLGHFDEALMITRTIIENNVCLDIILRYEKQGL